jgi:hypothetical protein
VAGVEWVALTDGNVWRIYKSHAAVPVEQKLFRVVNIADPAEHAEETLRLLAKAQMADQLIDDLWKSDFVDRQIRDALQRLFAPEPDPSLVRIVRSKTSALTAAEVRKSLGRLRTTFDFPVVSAPAERIERTPEARPARPRPAEAATAPEAVTAPKASGSGTPWRHVALADVIAAGLIRLPFEIEHRYRGVELRARIEGPGRIVFDGQAYDSLSTAGGMARKSVAGPFPGREIPQTNGWTFWEYRGPDGGLRVLDDLRRAVHDGKVISLASGRRPA